MSNSLRMIETYTSKMRRKHMIERKTAYRDHFAEQITFDSCKALLNLLDVSHAGPY